LPVEKIKQVAVLGAGVMGHSLAQVFAQNGYPVKLFDLSSEILKSPFLEAKVDSGHLGAKTSKGVYDYQGRSESEILNKRDRLYLSMLKHLDKINAFQPV